MLNQLMKNMSMRVSFRSYSMSRYSMNSVLRRGYTSQAVAVKPFSEAVNTTPQPEERTEKEIPELPTFSEYYSQVLSSLKSHFSKSIQHHKLKRDLHQQQKLLTFQQYKSLLQIRKDNRKCLIYFFSISLLTMQFGILVPLLSVAMPGFWSMVKYHPLLVPSFCIPERAKVIYKERELEKCFGQSEEVFNLFQEVLKDEKEFRILFKRLDTSNKEDEKAEELSFMEIQKIFPLLLSNLSKLKQNQNLKNQLYQNFPLLSKHLDISYSTLKPKSLLLAQCLQKTEHEIHSLYLLNHQQSAISLTDVYDLLIEKQYIPKQIVRGMNVEVEVQKWMDLYIGLGSALYELLLEERKSGVGEGRVLEMGVFVMSFLKAYNRHYWGIRLRQLQLQQQS